MVAIQLFFFDVLSSVFSCLAYNLGVSGGRYGRCGSCGFSYGEIKVFFFRVDFFPLVFVAERKEKDECLGWLGWAASMAWHGIAKTY
jgi:hypothetical protein